MVRSLTSKGRFQFVILLFTITASCILTVLCFYLFTINFEKTDIYEPFFSDRYVLPFPPLFEEFELDNKNALKSLNLHSREREETCKRRLADEYHNYRYNNDKLWHVNLKSFIVDGNTEGGWLSYTAIDKVVFVLIDGLRYDYVVHDPLFDGVGPRSFFTNRFPVTHQFMTDPTFKKHVRLSKLVAPIPTLTSFALKVFISGDTRKTTLMADNLDPDRLPNDNLGIIFRKGNFKVGVTGDSTIGNMMGKDFVDMKHTEPATNIHDLITNDKYVYENYAHVIPENNFTFIHLCNIDHLGHQGNRVSADMGYYLNKYSDFMKDVMKEISKNQNYLLLACGDHGHRNGGSHGGGKDEELETFLFMMSDLELQGRVVDAFVKNPNPPEYVREHNALNGKGTLPYHIGTEQHANIPTTLSLLMNVPIPFHSEGVLITDMVPVIKNKDGKVDKIASVRYLAQLKHINVHQILRTIDLVVYKHMRYSDISLKHSLTKKRLDFVNMYNFIRAMPADISKLQWEEYQLLNIYKSYISMCDGVMDQCINLIHRCKVVMTNDYVFFSIIVQSAAFLLLFAAFAFAIMVKKELIGIFNKGICDSNPIMKRVFVNALISLVITTSMHTRFIHRIEFGSLNIILSWPPRFVKRLFSSSNALDGSDVTYTVWFWFYFFITYVIAFAVLYVFNIPYIIVAFGKHDKYSRNHVNSSPNGDGLEGYHLHLFNFVQGFLNTHVLTIQLVGFTLIGVLTLVSECGIYSHDTMGRHIFLITFLTVLIPYAPALYGKKAIQDLMKGLFVFLILYKGDSLFHRYVFFEKRFDLAPSSWLEFEKIGATFEYSVLNVSIFVFLLLKAFSSKHIGKDNNGFEEMRSEILGSMSNLWPIRLIWVIQFFLCIVYFAAKLKRSYFDFLIIPRIIEFIIYWHDPEDGRVTMAIYAATTLLIVTIFGWLLIFFNPFSMIFPKKRTKTHHHNSCAIILVVITGWWLLFIIHKPIHTIHSCLGGLLFYYMIRCMLIANVKQQIGVFLSIFTLCDVLYFSSGHVDRIFDLDFDSAFVFHHKYLGFLSDIVVFVSCAMYNFLGSATAIAFSIYKTECEFESMCHSDYLASEPAEMDLIVHTKNMGFVTASSPLTNGCIKRDILFKLSLPSVVEFMTLSALHICVVLWIIFPLFNHGGVC
ncbi:bifunctional Alkaline-phosphatase-like [Babesia duncani]|uniref:Bifunctional Alkaline-phosphatase-like n=1 Tax=Babesia duncani TaxID=323732 RepID=A0AAD9PLS8_9APIC|nr:bifunctional Alkaline-phosphatase-like [Babesia duncani]